MEVAVVLYFLRNGIELYFYSLGTTFEENMRVSRGGAAPWLWVSKGAGSTLSARESKGNGVPVGTRLSMESLVCYTFDDR